MYHVWGTSAGRDSHLYGGLLMPLCLCKLAANRSVDFQRHIFVSGWAIADFAECLQELIHISQGVAVLACWSFISAICGREPILLLVVLAAAATGPLLRIPLLMQGNTVLIGSLHIFLHQTCPSDACWLAGLHSLLALPLQQARYTGPKNAATCCASLTLKCAQQILSPQCCLSEVYFTLSLDCTCLHHAQQKDVLLHTLRQNDVGANATFCLYAASGSGIAASEHGWMDTALQVVTTVDAATFGYTFGITEGIQHSLDDAFTRPDPSSSSRGYLNEQDFTHSRT